jgi:WD40 repeat protein
MTAPASDGTDSASGRFRLTIPQMLWLVALCGLACGFVVRALKSTERQFPGQLAFSPDGRLLAASFSHGGVLAWDVSGSQPRAVGFTKEVDDAWSLGPVDWVTSFQFVNEDSLAFVRIDPTGRGWRLILWEVTGDRTVSAVRLPPFSERAALSPDCKLAATINYSIGGVDVIDVKTGRSVRSLTTADLPVALAFVDDGDRIVAASPGQIEVFDTSEGTRLFCTKISTPVIRSAAVSPDGGHIAIVGAASNTSKNTLRVISADGTEVFSVEAPFECEVHFLRASKQIALQTASGVQIWEIPTGKQTCNFDSPQTYMEVAAVSPNGHTVAIAEPDRISLWDMRSGEYVREVWSRHTFLEAGLFSLALFGWAIVWGLMRRRRPKFAVLPADGTIAAADGPRRKPATFRMSIVRLFVLLAIVSILMALPVGLVVGSLLGGEEASIALVAVLTALLSPIVVIVVLVSAMYFLKQVMHYHGSELQRARDAARAAGRTAEFDHITAYFFGTPRLEAHFEQDLAMVRNRLETLLGEVAWPPHVPAFCFQSQQEFDDYLGRKLPLSAVYSPAWWARQLALCERSAYGAVDPCELLRTLLGYLLLWHHKGFRTPHWLTSVVNAYVTHGDDSAHLARVHRRLAVELDRSGTLAPLPHTLSDKDYVQIVLARNQREAFRRQQVYSDVCASLAAYLTDEDGRRARFGQFLRRLTRRAPIGEALHRDVGCGVEQLLDDWQAWLRRQLTEENTATSAPTTPADWVRRQIVEDFVPILLDPAADLELRCRTARSLGTAGSLVGAEALIKLLADGPEDLRQDALWSLEAIAGRRLGEDPAAWRAWLGEVAVDASAVEVGASRSPVEAELVDDDPPPTPTAPGPPPQATTDAPVEAVTASKYESLQTTTAKPITTPPRALTICWNLMVMGGAAAIFLSSFFSFEIGLTWWPLMYYGVALGVFAVARGVGRHTRWLRLVGLMQVLAAVSCDPINPVLGVAVLVLSRTKRAREYLAAQG